LEFSTMILKFRALRGRKRWGRIMIIEEAF